MACSARLQLLDTCSLYASEAGKLRGIDPAAGRAAGKDHEGDRVCYNVVLSTLLQLKNLTDSNPSTIAMSMMYAPLSNVWDESGEQEIGGRTR